MERGSDIESQGSRAGQHHTQHHSSPRTSAPNSRRWPWRRSRRQRQGKKPDVKVTKYGDTSATYWKLYASEAETHDEKFVQSLKSNTDSMVFLSGLFSAIVGSFIIEIYKMLLPDNSQRTVDLLSLLVPQTSSIQAPSTSITDIQSFTPPSVAVRINIVLFLSFFLSVMSAVACALIQQWCQEYMKFAYPRGAPHECGRVRTYLFQGLDRFQMRRFMYGSHVLLHISVFLFFWAISDFFYTIHPLVGAVTRYSLVASAVVYMALSISPLIFGNSPYNTPLTPPLRASGLLAVYGYRLILRCLLRDDDVSIRWRSYFKGFRFDKPLFLLKESTKRAKKLEPYAMRWLFTENDFSDNDMDKFLEGLPGYISSRHTNQGPLNDYLTADYILKRTKEHFMTCATSLELSDEASISRVSCCINSLRLIFQNSIKSAESSAEPDEEKLNAQKMQKTYIAEIFEDIKALCDRGKEDPIVALRASCVRALAVQGLLNQLASSDGGTTPDRPFGMSLIPLYTFFFQNDNAATIERLETGEKLSDVESKKTWKDLLHDGPLVNLTTLAKAVIPGELAPQSNLSFCWKTLDLLLKQLGIARTEVSESTLRQFNEVHEDTRKYVQRAERGFRVTRLLEILDAVARGRRLSMAFSGHAQYHSRADVVFGKEHIWNNGLLEAFARCLPDYMAKITSEQRKEFMEGMVCHDDLWTSLQVNLWNAQRSDSPTPSKLRVFEDCCTVLDIAFSALEDSEKVDWRAPEFGSLAQHFELFIAHCSQGAFMARTTSFRVGIIKARICKAVLSQFRDDLVREGTLFFRSEWDAASLARLICTLGTGDGEAAEFWKSYVDWGHIGAEFTPKARQMVDEAARDGPLLIFCKLGHLATTAVPLDGSGLGTRDIEKVLELQRNIIQDPRRPLTPASEKVWAELGQLQHQVSDLYSKNTSEDGDHLRHLLRMIDEVRHSHAPASKENSPSENAEAPGSKTLVAVKPRLLLRESRRSGRRSSFDSMSTLVTGGRSVASPNSEDSFGEHSAKTVLDPERNAHARWTSLPNDDAGSYHLPSPSHTIQSIPSEILDRTTSTVGIQPVNSSSPSFADTGQRLTLPSYAPARWNGSGRSAVRPRLTTVPGTGSLPTLRRNVSPIPVTSSPSGSFDLIGPGPSVVPPSPGVDQDERVN